MSRATDDQTDDDDSQREAGTPAAATSGRLLRRYRRIAGLTQEELAEQSGYSANYISKLERDQRRPPSTAMDRLADVLRLDNAQREAFRASRSAGEDQPRGPGGARLVGRRAELAEIDRYLVSREPPVLLFAGEPGIGKTRLLDEAAAHAAKSDYRVVRGDCPPWEQDPYSPLTDALARSIGSLPESERGAALADARSLSILVPDLVEAKPVGAVLGHGGGDGAAGFGGPEGERRALFTAVSRYFRRIAGPAGTLIVLDDLQWAGDDALRLLATLVTSSTDPAMRLVGAFRDSEVAADAPLRRVVADLARSARIRVVPLDPLSASETAQLLEELVPDDDERGRTLLPAIVRRAGGVPFFLVSYTEDLRLREGESTPSLELPWTVAEVIRQRVTALPEGAREILGIAAITGRVVPRSLVTRVAGMREEAVLGGLEMAAAARLLEEEGESGYRFVHDVIRETVEKDLSAGRKQLLHRRIGEALEEDPRPDVDALAHHFARSDDGEKAIHYLELAGDDAQLRVAHAAAIGFYRDAVDRLDRLDRAGDAAPIRERLGVALVLSGRYDEAIDVFERAVAVYREVGDAEGVRRVSGRIAEATFRRGGGHDTLEGVAALAGAGDSQSKVSPGGLRLRQGLFRLLLARGAYRQMLTGGAALARLGGATRNPRMEAMGAATQGVARIFLGQLSQGVPILEDAAPTLLAAGMRQEVADIGMVLGAAHLAMGSVRRCMELGEQMLRLARSLNDPVVTACHCRVLGMALYVQGDWEAGRVSLREADELLAPIGPSSLAVRTMTFRAIPLTWEGEWQVARDALQSGVGFARATEDVFAQGQALVALSELDLLEGDPHAAAGRLAPLIDTDLEWGYAVSLLSTLAWAYLEIGEVERAEHLARRAVERAERMGAWFHGVSALRIQGMIAARQGYSDAADAAYRDGLRRAHEMPFPYEEARLLHASGLLQRQCGDEGAARDRLGDALIIFGRLRARRDVERMHKAISAVPD